MMVESLAQQWTKNIQLLFETVLDLPPSCLEFLPKPNELTEVPSHLRDCYEEYFVVGTYYLEKEQSEETNGTESQHGEGEESLPTTSKPQSKNGSLILFRYQDKNL
jgi:diphthamide biosynthesis protein 7